LSPFVLTGPRSSSAVCSRIVPALHCRELSCSGFSTELVSPSMPLLGRATQHHWSEERTIGSVESDEQSHAGGSLLEARQGYAVL